MINKEMNSRADVFRGWLRIVLGLLVFSFGIHLTLFANIGVSPWDCLGLGIANHTPLNYGMATTLVSLVVLGIDVFLKEKIGYGTIIDAFLSGSFIQTYNYLNPFPENEDLWTGITIMLLGYIFIAIGMWLYMSAEQCCGPRDALLVGLGKRMRKVPIGIVEILLWLAVLTAGYFLGGPVGIGTLIGTFGAGLIMDMVYSIIGFEPRNLRHKGLAEVSRILAKGS